MAEMKNVEGVHRLSPTQAGMLYEVLSSEDPNLYFEQVRADISGPIDPERFEQSWQLVMQRHEALRSFFVWDGLDEPVQVVRRELAAHFEFDDWSERENAEVDLNRLADLRRETPIALTSAPLWNVSLHKLSNNHSHLIWDFHHMIADGWSAAIVLDDVLAAYDQTLPETPAPKFSLYIDWILRQDQTSGSKYWKALLDGVEAPTRFAVSTAGSNSETRYLARQQELLLDTSFSNALTDAARQLRVTPNTILQVPRH